MVNPIYPWPGPDIAAQDAALGAKRQAEREAQEAEIIRLSNRIHDLRGTPADDRCPVRMATFDGYGIVPLAPEDNLLALRRRILALGGAPDWPEDPPPVPWWDRLLAWFRGEKPTRPEPDYSRMVRPADPPVTGWKPKETP